MTAAPVDVLSAQIAADHLAAVRPPLPRAEQAQWFTLIAELTGGGHDPGDVTAALATWRARRAAGDRRMGRGTLTLILQDLEFAALAGADRYAVLCGACLNLHEPGDACLRWGGPR
jgi:hypothetical protein